MTCQSYYKHFVIAPVLCVVSIAGGKTCIYHNIDTYCIVYVCACAVLQLAGVTERRRQLEQQVVELQAAHAGLQSANASLEARLEAAEQTEASLNARCEALTAERDAFSADLRVSSDEVGRLK